jgi:rhamnosyl/mannosyltransferase
MTEDTKKKALFVAPYFKPHTGGLENYVANIEKGLRQRGWETIVVTSNTVGASYQEEIYDGTKVYRLPTWFKISNTPINPLWYFQLRKIIKREKPDIVNGHAPVPFIADMAVLASGMTPFVFTYHSGTMKKNKVLADVIIALYEKFLLKNTARRARKIICPSRFVITSLLRRYQEKASIITPGVDTKLFYPADPETVPMGHTVLFIARFANMYRMKGLYYLIEAVKNMPHVTLKVIGEPVSVLAKNVIFLGQKSIQETAEEMRRCSVLVLPSLAHMESFGMVLIEAMACRKPVIGTRIGGIPEVIRDGIDGILVPSQNISALITALERVIGNRVLAQTMAENGYRKVTTEFHWQKKIDETEKIFLSVIQEGKK